MLAWQMFNASSQCVGLLASTHGGACAAASVRVGFCCIEITHLLLLLLLLLLLILLAVKQTNAQRWSADFRVAPVALVVVCFSCGGRACLSCRQRLLRARLCAHFALLMSLTMQQMRQTHVVVAPMAVNIISVIYLLILLIYMQSVENSSVDIKWNAKSSHLTELVNALMNQCKANAWAKHNNNNNNMSYLYNIAVVDRCWSLAAPIVIAVCQLSLRYDIFTHIHINWYISIHILYCVMSSKSLILLLNFFSYFSLFLLFFTLALIVSYILERK